MIDIPADHFFIKWVQKTLYLPMLPEGLRISASNAAADASISNLLISRTAC